MKLLLISMLVGGAIAAPTKEAVALDCGEVLTLNDLEMMDVEFKTEKGITGECKFTIEGPKDYHVEVACGGGSASVDGQDATNYHGPVPAVIQMNLEYEDEQVYCRVGLQEQHKEPSALHGWHGVDTSIQEFEAAYNIHEKDENHAATILAANEQLITEINADRSITSAWEAIVTSMADKSEDEIKNMWTGKAPPPSQEEQDRRTEIAERELLAPLRSLRQTLPVSIDLTAMGRVSPAKSQGRCGSCSVFAGVSTIESCMHKATGVLPTDLSEQHMLDCAYGVGGNGCSGGSSDRYHEWMYRNHNGGLSNEAEYPYRAATTGTNQCENNTIPNANHGAVVTSHQESWASSEEDIMTLLAAGHSVTTGMQVEGDFSLLGNGVYQSTRCKSCRNDDGSVNRTSGQNHDITIVGYGVENGVKYWKLKNSWGSGWGVNGFGKFLRGVGHCCLGIDFSVPMCTASAPVTQAPATQAPATQWWTHGPGTQGPATTQASSTGTCGGTHSYEKGSLISEGYPTAYMKNQDCTWIIQKSGNQIIKFTVESLEIEHHSSCRYDYVQFNNSAFSHMSLGSGTASSSGKLCGSNIPAPIFSSGNTAVVKFHTDYSVQKKGFKINYEYVDLPSCKNQRISTAVGVQQVSFSTLEHPSNYANRENCDWTITVPTGQIVMLKFEAFATEYGYDQVKVYDGSSTASSKIGTYQGSTIPSIISSTGNSMLVTFTSDYSVTKKGFTAKATAAATP